MTTLALHFWEDPAFAEFVPYIKATAAWDKRQGKPRFDLKSNLPYDVLQRALAFRGQCADCGRQIAVFRARQAEANHRSHVAHRDERNEASLRRYFAKKPLGSLLGSVNA